MRCGRETRRLKRASRGMSQREANRGMDMASRREASRGMGTASRKREGWEKCCMRLGGAGPLSLLVFELSRLGRVGLRIILDSRPTLLARLTMLGSRLTMLVHSTILTLGRPTTPMLDHPTTPTLDPRPTTLDSRPMLDPVVRGPLKKLGLCPRLREARTSNLLRLFRPPEA